MKAKSGIRMKTGILIAAVLLFLCATAAPEAAFSQPPNDNFANATVLTGVSGQTTGINIDATSEPGEIGYGSSVWWKWTAPETGAFYFDTHGSDFNTVLNVYTGSAVDSLTRIAEKYNGSNSLVAFRAEAGTRYYIAVYGWQPGNIVLNWRKANSPANDIFANAIVLTGVSGQTTGTNIEATKEPGEPNHIDEDYSRGGGYSVWYSWTAPETDIFYFDTLGSSFKVLAVYTGSAVDSLIRVTDSIFHAKAGTRYYIAADSRWSHELGDIVLNWNKVIPRTAGNFKMDLRGRAFAAGARIGGSGCSVLAFGPGGVSDCRGKAAFINFETEWYYTKSLLKLYIN